MLTNFVVFVDENHVTYQSVFTGQVSAVTQLRLSSSSARGNVQPVVSSVQQPVTNGSVVDMDVSGQASATQPQFDRKLTNSKLLPDGADVVLTCHVTGSPVPNVSQLNLSSTTAGYRVGGLL